MFKLDSNITREVIIKEIIAAITFICFMLILLYIVILNLKTK